LCPEAVLKLSLFKLTQIAHSRSKLNFSAIR
jgi:hypothetical protein